MEIKSDAHISEMRVIAAAVGEPNHSRSFSMPEGSEGGTSERPQLVPLCVKGGAVSAF
jgi:hypothetical protein